MAIVKMKKLRLMAVRSKKDALLRELIQHGCLEFSELEGEVREAELGDVLRREDTKLMTLKSQHASLSHAVAILDKYVPAKSKLLSAKPEVAGSVLLDENGLNGALKVAAAIEANDDSVKRISAEESRQRSVIESLQPWLGLDLSLDCEGTERCSVLMGSLPGRIQLIFFNHGAQQ